MKRAAKLPHGAFASNDTPHENQISDTIHKSSLAAELYAGEVTPEERYQLIAEAAYYRSEQRNFAPGCELADWLDAEAEIETMIFRSR
jgi:hypothetical protein